MITSMAFAISANAVNATHTPTVEITPTLTTKGDIDFEIKVTNTGGDPITSVDVTLPFNVDDWVGTLMADNVAPSTSLAEGTVLFAGTGIPLDDTYNLTLAEGTPITIGADNTIAEIVSGITVIVPAGTKTGALGEIREIPGGAPGTSVGEDISGTLPITLDITNNQIKLNVDGAGLSADYTIVAAEYTTGADLVAAINTAITGSGATVSWDTDHIVFTSDTVGPVSSVVVADGTATAKAILGFSSPTETPGWGVVTLMYETRVTLGEMDLVKPEVHLPTVVLPTDNPAKLPAETEIKLTEPVTSSLPANVTLASDTHAVLGADVVNAILCEETEGKVGPSDITNATLTAAGTITCPLVADNAVDFPITITPTIKLLKGTKVVLALDPSVALILSELELGANMSVTLWEASTVVLDADVGSVPISATAEFGLPPDNVITATLTSPLTVKLLKDTEIKLPVIDGGVELLGTTAGTSVGADISGSLPITITPDTNDDIKLAVDGGAAVEYMIAAAEYTTGDLLVAAINTAIADSGATASWDTNHIVFTSDTVGSGSSVAVTAGTNDATADLGFSSPTETDGTWGAIMALPIPSNWKVTKAAEKKATWESTDGGIGPGASLTFSIRATVPETEGEYLWTIKTTDAEGKTGYKTLTTTVDIESPTLTVTMEPDMVGVGPATIKVVADEKLSKLDNVYYQIGDNAEHIGDPTKLIAMESADGITWTGTLTIPGDGPWDDNTVDIVVLAELTKDMAGNALELGLDVNIHSTGNRHIDTIPPVLPADLKMTDTTPFDNEVNQKSQLITGTASDNLAGNASPQDNLTVNISVNGTTYETKSLGEGAFVKEIDLDEGPNTVKVWVVDRVGNVGPENEQAVFLDSLKPTISMVSVAGETHEDNIPVNDSTPTVVLTIKDPGYPATALGIECENITVTLENADGVIIGSPLENATVWDKATGRFENTISEKLDEGFYRIIVNATDVIGNSDSATFWFEVDTIAPDMPSLTPANNPVLDDTSAAEPKVQNDTALVFYGRGLEVSSTAKIYLIDQATGSVISTETTEATATGDFSKSLTLAEGKVIRIEVETIDAAGNVSSRVTYGYVMIDATAPAVTLDELPEATDSTSIVLSGTVKKDSWEDWSDITLTVQLGTGQVTVPITEVSGNDGSYSYSLSLAEGSNTIVVQAIDEAGNPSDVAHATVERTVTPWGTYAIVLVIVALVMAAIAIFRKKR